MKKLPSLTLILSILPLLASCSSAYYSALEKVGVHKRDLVIKRVEAAREGEADRFISELQSRPEASS